MSTRPVPNAYLRVSDAERQQVADVLKQHASEGRLDQAEFEERLDHTLRAKTRADLSGLLDDLPHLGSEPKGGYDPVGYGPSGSGRRGHDRVPPSYPPGYAGAAYGPRSGDRGGLRAVLRIVFVVAAILLALSFVGHAVHFFFPWVIVLIVAAVVWHRNSGWHRRF